MDNRKNKSEIDLIPVLVSVIDYEKQTGKQIDYARWFMCREDGSLTKCCKGCGGHETPEGARQHLRRYLASK